MPAKDKAKSGTRGLLRQYAASAVFGFGMPWLLVPPGPAPVQPRPPAFQTAIVHPRAPDLRPIAASLDVFRPQRIDALLP